MSLLTLERSSPSPQESVNQENEDNLSCSSYEGFVAREHYAMCLSPRPWASLGPGRHGEQLRIFAHLKKLVKLMRSSDSLKLAVELENTFPRSVTKYLVLITTTGNQDTEETVLLGTEQEGSGIRLCLVLPLWRDTEIKLDGDGGFSIHTGDRHQVFKPTSVQSMWTALQALYKSTEYARSHNYYVGGLSHTWIAYYLSRLADDWAILNEWNILEDVESFRPDSLIYSNAIPDTVYTGESKQTFERLLVQKLRDVMMYVDLEEVTSKQLRLQLEEEMKMDLKDYRGYLDQQMLRILGQMERPSRILDYLYLGTEWNAAHLDELKELGVGYILNITREIDNFYPEVFKYLNIRLYDLPDSELMKHWDKTYQFIKEAKTKGSKVLVHCRMGISRSAATVTAFIMKEYEMSLQDALAHVKEKRSCINPNEGFCSQLRAYEGILKARHNELWGKQAPSRLQPWHKQRSLSEPNIWKRVQHIQQGEHNQSDEEPELTFLAEEEPVHTPGSSAPKSRPTWTATANSVSTTSLFPFNHSTPISKEESIRNYLASLPPLIVDDGFGENACTSESGSGFSSPILTPPDEKHMPTLSKLAKEVQQDYRQRLASEDLDSKESVSNAIEEGNTDAFSPITATTQPIEPPEVPREPPVSNVSGKEPVKSKVSPSPSSIASTANPSTRQQPVATNMAPPSKSIKSASLPHNISCTLYPSNPSNPSSNRATLSPNSSRTSLSSLSRNSPGTLQETNGEANLRTGDISPDSPREIDEVDFTSQPANDFQDIESRSDSPLAMSTYQEKLNLHRRVKSDTGNISGPIQTPQIYSVPERVKEIEEMHGQVTKGQTMEKEKEKENPVDFFIGSNARSSPKLPKRSSLSSQSEASSEGSVPSRPSSPVQVSPCRDQEEDPLSSGKPPRPEVRHESLSPKPSVCRSLAPGLTSSYSSMSLPHNISPLELNLDPPVNSLESKSDENVAQGAVRARVLDIEERNMHVRKPSLASSEKSTSSLKRSSPPNQRRPHDETPPSSRPSSMAESNASRESDCSSERNKLPEDRMVVERPPHPPQLVQRRPSRDIVRIARPSSVMESSEFNSDREPSLQSSARCLSVEDIPSQLANVQELKRKFETSGKPMHNSKVNLRRSCSLRDIKAPHSHSNPRRLISTSKLNGQVESARSSPHPEYITTIPFENSSKEVEDFQSTLQKFTAMASSAAP